MASELDLFEPFRRRRVEDWMNDFFAPLQLRDIARSPLTDIVDKGKTIEVTAELPGVNKKDIDIQVTDDSISLKTEARAEIKQEKEDKGYYFHERRYSGFYRKLPLPSEVISDKAKAEFNNGVLKIEIPKKHPAEKHEKAFKPEIK